MAELEAGARIGEWVVEETLGRGAFGITYRALRTTKTGTSQIAAIKEFYPSEYVARREDGHVGITTTARQEFAIERDMFLAEADTLASVAHPNVAAVYDVLDTNGTSYLVMELIDGPTLSKVVTPSRGVRDPMSVSQLVPVLRQLLQALAEIHGKNPPLLHRDIKPGNIVFRANDKSPVLIDFGAARQMIAGRSQKLTAILTKGYAPYEQYTLDEEEWEEMDTDGPVATDIPQQGPPTDLYALAATCYFALTGYAPRDSLYRKISTDTLRPLVRRVDGNRRILASIDKALSVEPKDRFATAKEWLAELDRAEVADVSDALENPVGPPCDDNVTVVSPSAGLSNLPSRGPVPTPIMARQTMTFLERLRQPLETPKSFYWYVLIGLSGAILLSGYFFFGTVHVANFTGGTSKGIGMFVYRGDDWGSDAGYFYTLIAGGWVHLMIIAYALPFWLGLAWLLERRGSIKRHVLGFAFSIGLAVAVLTAMAWVLDIVDSAPKDEYSALAEFALGLQNAEGVGELAALVIRIFGSLAYLFLTFEVVRSLQVFWSGAYRQRVLAQWEHRLFGKGR